MEVVIRVALIYIFLMAALRVMGKREFSELTALEFVSLLLIPQVLAQALISNDSSLTTGVLAVLTLLALALIKSFLTLLSPRAEVFVDGTPTILAYEGKLVPENMQRERITPGELYSELRKNGLERVEQALWVTLESDGKISVVSMDATADG